MANLNINKDDLNNAIAHLESLTEQVELTIFGDDKLPRRGKTFPQCLNRFIHTSTLLLEDVPLLQSANELWLTIGLDLEEFEFMVDGSGLDEDEYEKIVDLMDGIEEEIDLLKNQFEKRVKEQRGLRASEVDL
jgi:tetrahydromethanopterin S-methyltransferase subunit G